MPKKFIGVLALTALVTLAGPAVPPAAAAPAAPLAAASAAAERILRPGARGEDVASVQSTLKHLRYFTGEVNSLYAEDLVPAVWGFQKDHGIRPSSAVGPETRRALKHPSQPAPLVRGGAPNRVEVSLGRQMMSVYRGGRIALRTHISSGSGKYYCAAGRCRHATTPTGDFRVFRRVNGWDRAPLGNLYKPLYFLGGFALHGSIDVPLKPSSHGCIRLPMALGDLVPQTVKNGWPVHIRR
jgi:lipoprotein-anchoring transpeptidase ErfK/SrfK